MTMCNISITRLITCLCNWKSILMKVSLYFRRMSLYSKIAKTFVIKHGTVFIGCLPLGRHCWNPPCPLLIYSGLDTLSHCSKWYFSWKTVTTYITFPMRFLHQEVGSVLPPLKPEWNFIMALTSKIQWKWYCLTSKVGS